MRMRKLIWLLALLLLPCAALGESESLAGGIAVHPDDPWTAWYAACVPVYDAPEADAAQTGWLFHHTPVQIVEKSGDYVRIEAEGVTGWLTRDYLHLGDEITQWDQSTMLAVALEENGAEYSPLIAEPGSDVEVGEVSVHWLLTPVYMTMDGDWMLVKHRQMTGWIPTAHAGLTNQYEGDMLYCPRNTREPLYAEPSTDSVVLGEYFTGVRYNNVWADYKPDGWQRVSIAGTGGWFCYESDNVIDRKGLPSLRHTLTETVLLSSPDENAEPVDVLAADTPAEILGVAGSWLHVRLKDGRSGYADAACLGGVPEEADSPYVLLKEDVVKSYNGELVFPAGTMVRIGERPYMRWRYIDAQDENGQWHGEWRWVLPDDIWIAADDKSAGASPDALDVGW